MTPVFTKTITILQKTRFSDAWYVIATAALAAGGQSRIIPRVYQQAVQGLGPAPLSKQPAIPEWQSDLPRRQVVRKMRETLVKSTILVGVAHCIEASWVLSGALEEGDKDDTFVREGYDNDGQALKRGSRGLGRIYQHNDASLMEKFGKAGIPDIAWLSRAITYGQLLEPIRPETPKAAIDIFENSLLTLTCLMGKKAYREVMWHLRGCLRIGMSAEEVELCQQAIEACLAEVQEYQRDDTEVKVMPRVTDVTEEDTL
ncbi:hypothetical protein P389DRAFT_31479 [Cystobasidium minutum MCA 4210]|uniref:uncharacterized protein n=1 Tax=Cystobasidium minutum MCA 4210 TaxID=1397322 RepID=UPI0034CEBF5C|eukprot:jgi/Rhomi1/31479/CE31478_308